MLVYPVYIYFADELDSLQFILKSFLHKKMTSLLYRQVLCPFTAL
jgi:hypothetical protein